MAQAKIAAPQLPRCRACSIASSPKLRQARMAQRFVNQNLTGGGSRAFATALDAFLPAPPFLYGNKA